MAEENKGENERPTKSAPESGSVFAMLDESALKLEEAQRLLGKGDAKGSAMLIREHLKMNREAKGLWEKQNDNINQR